MPPAVRVPQEQRLHSCDIPNLTHSTQRTEDFVRPSRPDENINAGGRRFGLTYLGQRLHTS